MKKSASNRIPRTSRGTTEKYELRDNIEAAQWNEILSQLRGHPLQSAIWGHARNQADKIKDARVAIFYNDSPICLVRYEIRTLLGIIKFAWIPQGPTILTCEHNNVIHLMLLQYFRKNGYLFCAMSSWHKVEWSEKNKKQIQTIWLDISIGRDKLWQGLNKQFRYEIRRAHNMGVIIEKTNYDEDIKSFYELCLLTSQHKQFQFRASYELMKALLLNNDENVNFSLFVARVEGKFCGGAFIARCGKSIHYIWGAVDRGYSKYNIGEAIQWAVIEWAINKKCNLYDLEGIDPKNNYGTYKFKKKLGGEIITLPGKQAYPLYSFIKYLMMIFQFKNIFEFPREYETQHI